MNIIFYGLSVGLATYFTLCLLVNVVNWPLAAESALFALLSLACSFIDKEKDGKKGEAKVARHDERES